MVSSMYILKDSLCLTTSIAAILFFYGTVIISWEHLKRSICQGHWVYFTTLIAILQKSKRSVVDSRKFEGYCVYLKKAIVAMLCWGVCLFHRTSCSNFCLKSTLLNTRKHLQPFYSVMVNIFFFKTPLAVKTTYFFQSTFCSRQFFKTVSHSIWREELRQVILSFKRTGFFWWISLSHPFFHMGWFF